jgi:hypothetical protein
MARQTKGKTARKGASTPEIQDATPPIVVEEPHVEIIDAAVLDEVLSLQLLVAWAGEGKTDPPRLGWWRTSLVDEFGGEDLFARLLPRTWKWAVLDAARTAARTIDAEARAHAADGDQLISLFHFGFALDEQLDDRLAEHRRSEAEPSEVLPRLAATRQPWNADTFLQTLRDLALPPTAASSIGRRLKGAMPASPVDAARQLAAAMVPPGDRYPAPHWKLD